RSSRAPSAPRAATARPASAWRSRASSSRRTVAGSGSRTQSAGRACASACRRLNRRLRFRPDGEAVEHGTEGAVGAGPEQKWLAGVAYAQVVRPTEDDEVVAGDVLALQLALDERDRVGDDRDAEAARLLRDAGEAVGARRGRAAYVVGVVRPQHVDAEATSGAHAPPR